MPDDPAPEPALRFEPPEAPPPGEALPVAVLVSGGGTTLQNFINERERGRLRVDVRLVISSRRRAYALQRAASAEIPSRVIERRAHPDEASFSDEVFAACEEAGARLICMAGWLCKVRIPERWLGRVVNIHPALLPAFGGEGMYGDHVHRAVLEYGCRLSGCTVHAVDDIYDHGPVIVQRAVPILRDDTVETLKARVFHEECLAYPQALRLFVEGRIAYEGRRVVVGNPR